MQKQWYSSDTQKPEQPISTVIHGSSCPILTPIGYYTTLHHNDTVNLFFIPFKNVTLHFKKQKIFTNFIYIKSCFWKIIFKLD